MSHALLKIQVNNFFLSFQFLSQRMPSLPSRAQGVVRWWPEPFTLFLHRGTSRCPWRCRDWSLWQPREGNHAASRCLETATYTCSSCRLRKKSSKRTMVSSVRCIHAVWLSTHCTKTERLTIRLTQQDGKIENNKQQLKSNYSIQRSLALYQN